MIRLTRRTMRFGAPVETSDLKPSQRGAVERTRPDTLTQPSGDLLPHDVQELRGLVRPV
jgi:hypothetical protein